MILLDLQTLNIGCNDDASPSQAVVIYAMHNALILCMETRLMDMLHSPSSTLIPCDEQCMAVSRHRSRPMQTRQRVSPLTLFSSPQQTP